MTDMTNCALVPLPPGGTEIALPEALVERAKDYMSEALAQRTREAYARWWRVYTGWCEHHGRRALPASPETIAAWLTALADGTDSGRPLARASINQALAAVTLAHRNAGHAFDRKHRLISMTWSGISRVKAMTEVERQAAPVIAADVRDLLAMLNTARNIGCRNAALLTLGWGAALRRSELVGLDWEQIGEGGKGAGFVRIDERGILITLARSKASQDKAETIVMPRADLPEACEALEAWAQRAALQPGQPIFRAVNNRHHIATERSRRTASRASSRRPCATSPAGGASRRRRPRIWCAGSPATRSGPATPRPPRRPTCRRCASSSIPATNRPTWLRATSGSPTSGRRADSRASCSALGWRRSRHDED
jgi:site-specific recombinase XerD